MPTQKHPLPYEEIQDTPAGDLLQLSLTELNAFIKRAKKEARDAHAFRDWLVWLKAEKLLRESPEESSEGGDQ